MIAMLLGPFWPPLYGTAGGPSPVVPVPPPSGDDDGRAMEWPNGQTMQWANGQDMEWPS